MMMRHLRGGVLTAALLFACQSTDGAGTETAGGLQVTTADEPAGEHCAAGGKRLDITSDGVTSTVYVCDGLDGDPISVADAGEQCPHGGAVIQVGSNSPIVVCNGKDGASAETVVIDAVEPGEDCAHGGVSLRVGEGQPTFVCHGEPGAKGDKGDPGESVTLTPEPAGDNCPRGGTKVQVGSEVRYVCDGDALIWHEVTADAQTQPNAGYLANGASDVTLTLPETSSLRGGDVIRVINGGTGSVSITPNEGQSFRHVPGALAPPTNFVPREQNRPWWSIATSADGKTIIASDTSSNGGHLYVSTDFGESWTSRGSLLQWGPVASSADGTKLAAAPRFGQIFVSDDGGETWTPRTDSHEWTSIATSTDGAKMFAVARGRRIHVSTDSGQTWTQTDSPVISWSSIAASADGTRLIAGASNPTDELYTSADSGATWTQRESQRVWNSVASSADGAKLLASAGRGHIYTSTDWGLTWTQRESSRQWSAVASSADGATLLAGTLGGQLYVSINSGLTWTPRESSRDWRAVAVSSDGTKFVAAVSGGQIYVNRGTGSLVSRAPSLVELTYTGGGQFFVSDVKGIVDEP